MTGTQLELDGSGDWERGDLRVATDDFLAKQDGTDFVLAVAIRKIADQLDYVGFSEKGGEIRGASNAALWLQFLNYRSKILGESDASDGGFNDALADFIAAGRGSTRGDT